MVRRDTCRRSAACISDTLRPYFSSGFIWGVVGSDTYESSNCPNLRADPVPDVLLLDGPRLSGCMEVVYAAGVAAARGVADSPVSQPIGLARPYRRVTQRIPQPNRAFAR